MSDRELVKLVKSFLAKRNASPTAEECFAWEEFFSRCDLIVRNRVGMIHKALDVIDDVTQDVWIMLIKKLPRWRFDPALGSIGAWVTKVAHRLAVKRARRHARQQAESLSKTLDETLVDPTPRPDIEFEWMQEHEFFASRVLDFAASLPESDGRIVVLHWVEACPLSKIASILNLAEDAVWWVIRRFKPKLLDYLRRSGFGQP